MGTVIEVAKLKYGRLDAHLRKEHPELMGLKDPLARVKAHAQKHFNGGLGHGHGGETVSLNWGNGLFTPGRPLGHFNGMYVLSVADTGRQVAAARAAGRGRR